MDLNFNLHPKQMEIFQSDARFKVVAAGRRFGKSYLSAILLIINALKTENQYGQNIKNKEVWYIAPTFTQGKDIMWSILKDMAQGIIDSTLENTATIRLVNGRKIQIKGSDRPDSLRGVGISFVVLDEFAFMKPSVWEEIIRPTLADVRGEALFIGTPDGKNHFYDIWKGAYDWEDWEPFCFSSIDNPTIDPKEIEQARSTMSESSFRQEFEASFSSTGAGVFLAKDIAYSPEPDDGVYYIAMDPAGYAESHQATKSKLKRLDETAIAVVKVHKDGWWIKEIDAGRWGVRETALKVLRHAQKVRCSALGIEKGSLYNAVMPYLEDTMRRLNYYPRILPLTHGGKKKSERIAWALQGRFQHGRIAINEDDRGSEWVKKFIDQLLDFPNPMVHDDLLDSLAYVDQIATTNYPIDVELEEWTPTDDIAGY